MTPFDAAWSIIKAFPEESLYSQRSRGDYRGGYGRMPFRSIFQTRHKTMHPAIQGIMDIIPLEIPIRDQIKVLSLQLSVWIAKALYTL